MPNSPIISSYPYMPEGIQVIDKPGDIQIRSDSGAPFADVNHKTMRLVLDQILARQQWNLWCEKRDKIITGLSIDGAPHTTSSSTIDQSPLVRPPNR